MGMSILNVTRDVMVISCLMLAGCPVQFEVDIQNDTNQKIYILSGYSDVVLSEIEPGEADEVAYNFDCFRVKFDDFIYEFTPVMPSGDYVTNGQFKSSFHAVFTGKGDVMIYKDNKDEQDGYYLNKGCKKHQE